MPFAAPSMTDEDDLKAKEKNGAGVNVSGTSTTFATGVPGQDTGSGQAKETGSGAKFANIQGYLDANKSQGEEMGQKIASDVNTNAADATQKVTDFETKAPEIQAYDPNEAFKNVTTLSDSDKAAYNQAKAGYQGPQTVDKIDGYGDTQSAVSRATQQVANAGNDAGQMQLLKDTYNRPQYTGGENALDQTILHNAPGARQGFEDLTNKYSKLGNMFDIAAQDVGGKINQSISTGLANQNAIATGEVNAKSSLLDPIRQRAAQVNQGNEQAISDINADISDDTLSDQTRAALGLDEGQHLYDLNLASYLSPDHTQSNINNVANADERAKYAALTSLIDGQAGNEITADGKAINPVSFDRANFDKDYAARKAEADRLAAATNLSQRQTYESTIGDDLGVTKTWDDPYTTANMNISDYLAGKRDPTYANNYFNFTGPEEVARQAQAQAQAKNSLFAQIEQWLADNKISRTIKKG